MKSGRRSFQRSLGELRYRKMFVISTEGQKTEPQYLRICNDQSSVIQVTWLKCNTDSSPKKVLQRMEKYLRQEGLKSSDEAWLVVDKDKWTDEQLVELHAWAATKENYDFALSNPKFEYWLLLHFEDGNNITSPSQCDARLMQHLPDYDKQIDARHFTPERIDQAVQRAKKRDQPPCADWPRSTGSTVYRLVERIREKKNL